MRHATRYLGVLVLCVAGGCGGSDPHEVAAKDTIQAMNDLATLVESVTDEASAQAAAPKVKELAGRMQELQKRMRAMGTPSAEKMESLKKYEGQMKAAMGRLLGAAMKATAVPGAQAALQDAFKALPAAE